ncbi:MAG: hypothetical protein AAFR98_12855, partial [Pseudomonadota bacterium]
MRHDLNITLQGADICGSQSNHGIMKVDGACAERGSPTAKADLADGISRANGRKIHPHEAGEPLCAPDTWVGKEASAMRKITDGDTGRTLEIGTAKYQKYLDDPALSPEQKDQIIESLWTIIAAFVDLGFEVHPAQVVMDEKGCGQLADPLDQAGHTDSNEIKPVDECKTKDERASDD